MKLSEKNKLTFNIILSIILSVLVECYVVLVENSNLIINFSNDFFKLFSLKEFIVFFIVFFIIFYIFLDENRRNKTLNFIYNYRLPLSIMVICVAVIFQIHGSSINELNLFGVQHKPLLGVSRPIRSDEYVVNTMFAFSQYFNDFGYFSDIVRATTTDMFIIYGQPVLDIGMIFRPFLSGYLFLNQGQGLSFFWVSRLVFLLLVSFEFGMLLTNKNKTLSFAYALLITFSPIVQWWFAINGLVEQLIFGQLGVLLINWYMTTENYRKRLLCAIGLMISIGTFILVFYPSWQIPYTYIFMLLAIWIFLKNLANFTYNKKDLIIFSIVIIIFSLVMVHVLNNSLETIKMIFNSSYPGSQKFNGDGVINALTYYIPSIFFPLKQSDLIVNVCNYSVFMDLFPIPLILSGIVLLYQKTKDKLLIGLIALYFIFIIFYYIPLPDLILDLTLRGTVKTTRLPSVITFIGVLILIRSMSSLKNIENKKLVAAIAVILSIIMVYWSSFEFGKYYLSWMFIIGVIVYSIIFTVCCLSSSEKNQRIFLITVICLSFLTGALVNPVDHGTDALFESNHYKHIGEIVEKKPDGIWIVQDFSIINNNIPISAGAKTINAVNTYPSLETWQKLDPNNQSYDTYNRYAHILIDLVVDNNTPSSFELKTSDSFVVHLNMNDLEKLNVTFIESVVDLDKYSNENVKFIKMYEDGKYKIFKVEYI